MLLRCKYIEILAQAPDVLFSGTAFETMWTIGCLKFNLIPLYCRVIDQVNKHMNRFSRWSSAFLLALMAISSFASAQQNASIQVGGPCAKCSEHILGVVKGIDGVAEARYDAATNLLTVAYGAGTSMLDISLELSLAGYDAGDFRRDARAKMPPCCQSSTRGDVAIGMDGDTEDLMEGLEDDASDWENPDNLEALDNLSAHKTKSAITDEDLEDEEDDDDLLNLDDE
jgi:hypothetical protein